MKNLLKRIIIVLLCLIVVVVGALLGLNAHVKGVARDNIISPESVAELGDTDCIVVLGCQVKSDGMPSDMLRDRLRRGVELYKNGIAPKIIMSGDHGQKEYDEVTTMKNWAIENGVPEEDIFMDHAGFSTYESVYRAKEIFGAKRVVIVTQEYHLYRALYIAEKLGLEGVGAAADYHIYAGQAYRDLREVAARCKDFFTTLFKVKPTYLGPAISLAGSGNVTNG